jgi:subtilase family serine protease
MSAARKTRVAGVAAGGMLAVLGVLALASGGAGAQASPGARPSAQSVLPPPTLARCLQVLHVPCYTPPQLQRAYDLRPLYRKGLNGRGSTIVIVDPFGSPTIGHDLRVFDHAFGLPNPPVLRVLQPVGAIPPFNGKNAGMVDKAAETTLDVEWSHAIAPGASILLVETPVQENSAGRGFPQFMAAENYVVDHNLGDVISQSFSLPEQNFGRARIARLRLAYRNAERHHVTVLAATNDNGVTGPKPRGGLYAHRIVEWPASDPLVTAVGGTKLHLNAAGRRTSPDTVWNDTYNPLISKGISNSPPPVPWASNGGVSLIFSRPSDQDGVRGIVGDGRGVPDVSMSAAFSGGVMLYETYPGAVAGGWSPANGGTSEATPEFAGIIAIADQYARTRLHKGRLGLINPALYRLARSHASGIVDVAKGNNTVAFPSAPGKTTTVKGYAARRGYDLATGVGTIDAARFVPKLAAPG